MGTGGSAKYAFSASATIRLTERPSAAARSSSWASNSSGIEIDNFPKATGPRSYHFLLGSKRLLTGQTRPCGFT